MFSEIHSFPLKFNTSKKILVIGDIMLDEYWFGDMERISPEAPVPVLKYLSSEFRLGGSANVAKNLTSLGANVSIVGIVGDDVESDRLKKLLFDSNIDTSGLIVSKKRPTTRKLRLIARKQQVLRVDSEDPSQIDGEELQGVINSLKKQIPECGAIIVSDYRKGLITEDVIEFLVNSIDNRVCVADSKAKNYLLFKGFTTVAPNLKEVEAIFDRKLMSEEDIIRSGRELLRLLGSKAVHITRGADGISLFTEELTINFPAFSSEVYDVTGAGDTVTAVLTLSLMSGFDMIHSTFLANVAAAIVVRKVGTSTTNINEIERYLREEEIRDLYNKIVLNSEKGE
ncbi:MAG TPA: D-glycero-beta-D-manno-heptose-7-phosphate kinase [Thermodesulfobium narugense]|nr:MAG: D-glycero-beta-D-manno-heptose-7-phosphate kinase [Thermodesulfobium narugense]HEM56370.1 D-glycero-beta-D-manno-heptose-7-phosphate kinase [Thermodesulfobium narugense]